MPMGTIVRSGRSSPAHARPHAIAPLAKTDLPRASTGPAEEGERLWPWLMSVASEATRLRSKSLRETTRKRDDSLQPSALPKMPLESKPLSHPLA